MLNKAQLFFFIAIILNTALVTAFTGCGGTSSSMPNPAAEKCIRDGFELKPIIVNGVPRGYRCVDPRSGKSCEVWEYYRNRCDLSTAVPLMPPKSQITNK